MTISRRAYYGGRPSASGSSKGTKSKSSKSPKPVSRAILNRILNDLCLEIFNFLSKDSENVIAIHCNAGKGRTGTLICCYMLFCGFADNAQNALTYYGWKRF
jgi:hypothetical protein